MTRHELLNIKFREFLDGRRKYGDTGRKALATALDGFAEYLGVPEEDVRFLQPDEEYNRDRHRNSLGSAQRDSDGWWSGSLAFEADVPGSVIVFRLWAFVAANGVQFRAGDGPVVLTMPPDDVSALSLKPLFEAAFQRAKTFMEKPPVAAFLEQDETAGIRPIGFVWPEDVL